MEERYPADLKIGLDDFTSSGWRQVLDATRREGYPSMWQALSDAARKAMEEGRQNHGKVLWQLADACSMMLSPKSPNEPFKPIFMFGDRRSILPEDLGEDDIRFFSEILDSINELWLKARIGELLWLLKTPKDPRHALVAIDSYRAIPLEKETWFHGGDECWRRALTLARMLRRGVDTHLEEMEKTIIGAFEGATCADGFLGKGLADLLEDNGLGRDKGGHIAQQLEKVAREFDGEGDLHHAREYFSGAAKWFGRTGDESKAAEMTTLQAESWVKEAIARMSSDQPSYMVAASFYENAIQLYRTIPHKHRAAYRVDERLIELYDDLKISGEKARDEMSEIRTPGIDISKLIENARNAVHGKSATEALKAFANLHRGAITKQLREQAIQQLRDYPLHGLFPVTVMSRDGRVIAKQPGMSLGSTPSDGDEITIRAEMIRNYNILVSIVVQGDILPAHDILLLEHRLREADFTGLASQSPIVPKGRERLLGKALFAGYDRDFVTALHLLVPQIEHMVRWHLKGVGAKTTTLSPDGIETENSLSTLMDMPEAIQVFGENFVFEIKTLFCDAFGPNLRNEIAHGLIDDEACHSVFGIYAWWLALRLIFNTWWNMSHDKDQRNNENGSPDRT